MYQQDKRVIKTRKNIRETFLSLLKETPFDKITVTQIADSAMIGKTTFYLHYSDKYELAEECIRDFLFEIECGIRQHCLREGIDRNCLTELICFMGSLTDRISLLNRISINSFYLYDKIRDTISLVLKDVLRAGGYSEPKLDMITYQLSSIIIDFLRYKSLINPGAGQTEYIQNLFTVFDLPQPVHTG